MSLMIEDSAIISDGIMMKIINTLYNILREHCVFAMVLVACCEEVNVSSLNVQNISSLQKWAETSCELIKNSVMFEECREVVGNVDEFYANCVYDSCRLHHHAYE